MILTIENRVPESCRFVGEVKLRMYNHLEIIPPVKNLIYWCIEAGSAPDWVQKVFPFEFSLFFVCQIEKSSNAFYHCLH